MTIRDLVDDIVAFDQAAYVQLAGLATLVAFTFWCFYWLYRASIKNGDVAVEAEQVLFTTETAASFHVLYHPSAAHVAISEAHALPRISEGISS